MDAVTTMRFAAWRELRGRPILVWGGPALVALAQIPDGDVGEAAMAFVCLLMTLGAPVLAARGEGGPDAFWRGLGGPAWARLAGAGAVHAGTLGTGFVLAGSRIDAVALFLGLVALTLSAGVTLCRATQGGLRSQAGILLAGVPLGVATWAAWQIRGWDPGLASLVRMVVLQVTCLAGAFVLEGRYGVWGAGVRRGAYALLALPILAVGLTVIAEAAWPWPTGELRVIAVSADGARIVRSTTYLDDSDGRAWLWQDGVQTRLPVTRLESADVGPGGSVVVRNEARDVVLIGADGRTVRCLGRASILDGTWSREGRAFTWLDQDDRWELDLDAGCRPVATGEGGRGRDPYVHDAGGAPFVVYGDSTSWREDGAPRLGPGASAYRVVSGERVLLSRADAYLAVAGGLCETAPVPRCWTADGRVLAVPPGFEPVDATHALDGRKLIDLETGITRIVPAVSPFVVFRGAVARVVTATAIHDLAADGSVETLRY